MYHRIHTDNNIHFDISSLSDQINEGNQTYEEVSEDSQGSKERIYKDD